MRNVCDEVDNKMEGVVRRMGLDVLYRSNDGLTLCPHLRLMLPQLLTQTRLYNMVLAM